MLALSEVEPSMGAEVGGKALHLARLARAGLPVPPGRVLPVSSFRDALQAGGLFEQAEAVQRDPSEGGEPLRAAILAIQLDDALSRSWVQAARALGPRVAVRSSGVDEDGAVRSFAGQHLTELHVRPEGVPAAILRCWASLYEPRALAYRGGSGPAPGSLAVLVQQMVEPAAAGVLFTINPLNGSWREMVVEAVWGLGEGLVSGQIAPHWYLVRRPRRAPRPVQRVLDRVRLQVMQEDLPELPERLVGDPDGAVRRELTPASLRGRRTLEPHALRKLCRLGLRVERALGEPQDIEWARGPDGRFVLLQARPITAAGTPRARDDVLWTRRFIGERWPEPATPLGWSILRPLLEWFIAYPRTQAAYLGGGPALKLVNSRPYINATVFRHLAFKLPGAPPPRFMLELVPPEEERAWRQRFAVAPHVAVYASILRTTLEERRWERFRWNPLTNDRAWDRFRDRLEDVLPALSRTPTSPSDAVALVHEQVEWIREYCGVHVCSLLFANIFYQLLEAALAGWAPEHKVGLMGALATCPQGNLTVETNTALHALAAAASDAELDALDRGERPTSGAFAERLDDFLERFGHRSEASWELMSPRWRRDPARLVPLLRAQRSARTDDPEARAARQEQAYEAAMRQLGDLATGTRLATLQGLVHFTRRYLLLRENQRFWFDKLLWSTQETLLWLGDHGVAEGWLADREDVSYLTWPELQGLVDGSLSPDAVDDWVARRRAQREADLQEEPPTFLVGDDPGEPPGDARRLQGLGISAGRVRGRVRVLRSLAEGHLLESGEILVTRAVDPGWTPLFLTAGAVVLEMGSVLSHGAVVAREYGVPAVVNLEGITRRLRDGQEVTVDGTRGVVWLHP